MNFKVTISLECVQGGGGQKSANFAYVLVWTLPNWSISFITKVLRVPPLLLRFRSRSDACMTVKATGKRTPSAKTSTEPAR